MKGAAAPGASLRRPRHSPKRYYPRTSGVQRFREAHRRQVNENLICPKMVRHEKSRGRKIFGKPFEIRTLTMADAASGAAAAAPPAAQPSGTVAVKPLPSSGASAASKKASKGGAAKKARAKPSHPPTSEMVNNAVKSLKERGGSSLQAIKKYIAASYKVDAEKLSPFIKKYLKAAVTAGTLVQTKGKGASGSFKLSSTTLKEKAAPSGAGGATKAKKAGGAKKTGVKKPKAVGAKKSSEKTTGGTKRSAPKERSKSAPPAKKAKKAAEKPKKKAAAGKPAAKAAKSPSKAKKAATKPRAPKPKKTPTKAKPAAKKPAAQKKK